MWPPRQRQPAQTLGQQADRLRQDRRSTCAGQGGQRLVSLLREISSPVARKLLLVDDDEIMRESVRRVLEQESWEVAGASNGRVALEQLAGSSPDVIVLDLMMPEMDGFEFLTEMRQRPQFRDIPVLVLTAKDLSAEDLRRLNGHVERVMRAVAQAHAQTGTPITIHTHAASRHGAAILAVLTAERVDL